MACDCVLAFVHGCAAPVVLAFSDGSVVLIRAWVVVVVAVGVAVFPRVQAKGSREEAEALVGLEVFKALGFALKIAV